MKGNSQNTFFIGLAGLAVIGAIIILLVKNGNSSTPAVTPTPTHAYQVTGSNSNDDLQKDMDTVNTSFNSTNDSTTNVNTGINDTPVPQPNY